MGGCKKQKVMSTPTNLNLINDKYHGHQAFSLKNGFSWFTWCQKGGWFHFKVHRERDVILKSGHVAAMLLPSFLMKEYSSFTSQIGS